MTKAARSFELCYHIQKTLIVRKGPNDAPTTKNEASA